MPPLSVGLNDPSVGGGQSPDSLLFGLTSQIPVADGVQIMCPTNLLTIGVGAPTLNRLMWMPFFTGPGGVIDAIGIATTVSAGAGGICRTGIYSSRRAAGATRFQLSPGKVLLSSPLIDTTAVAGILLATGLTFTLEPNALVWLSCVFSVAAPTCRTSASVTGLLGFTSTFAGPLASQFLDGINAALALPDVSNTTNFSGPTVAGANAIPTVIRFIS